MRSIGISRKVFGIEQVALAERAGISRRQLHEIETGGSFGSRRTIKAIDDAFVALLAEQRDKALREATAEGAESNEG